MTASATDKVRVTRAADRPAVAYLAATKSIGASSITVNTTTGWGTSTAVDFIIYRKDASGSIVPGTLTTWTGVVSGTSINGLTLQAGTDQSYQSGEQTVVQATPTAAWSTDLANALLALLNPDGSIKQNTGFFEPTGKISMFGGTSAPSGYLLCDGTAVSRATYSTLFAVIGTSYGSGDGSTTFNLPNMKGRVPVGMDASDTDFNTLGKSGGQKTVQAHTHQISPNGGIIRQGTGTVANLTIGGGSYALGASVDQTGSTGNGSTNMNPYLSLNYIIKS